MKKIIVLALLHTGIAVSDLPKIINLPKIQLPKEQKDVQNLLNILGAQNEAQGIQKATVLVNDQNSLKIIKGIIGEQDTTKAIDILQSVQRAIPSMTSLRDTPEKIKALTLDQGHLERVKRIMQQNDIEQLIKTISALTLDQGHLERIKRIMQQNDVEQLIKTISAMQDTIKNQKNEIELLKQNQTSSIPAAPPVLGTPQAPNIPATPPILVAPPVKQPSTPSKKSSKPSTDDLLRDIQEGKKLNPVTPNPKSTTNPLLKEIQGGKKLNPVSSNPRPAEIPKKDGKSLQDTLKEAMDARRENIREGDEEDNGADASEWD